MEYGLHSGSAGREVEYEALRPRLERRFRRWFPSLRGLESDLYQDAWESLLRHGPLVDAAGVENPTEVYLERALYTRGIDELRRRERGPGDVVDAGRPEVSELLTDRTAIGPEEFAIAELDVRDSQTLLLERLSSRQRRIIKLHWGWGLSLSAVADALQLSVRTVRREIEEAGPQIAENASWLTPCSDGARRSLVQAYVLGVLGKHRAELAERHLAECVPCRALRDQLEETLRGVAALVPIGLVLDPPAVPGALERVAHAASDVREQITDIAGGVKQQAAALVSRSPAHDSAAHMSAIGGAQASNDLFVAAAKCAGALGVAIYCALTGVPEPIRSVLPATSKAEHVRDQRVEPTASEASTHPEPPLLTAATAPPAKPSSSTSGSGGASAPGESRRRRSRKLSPAEEEFGSEAWEATPVRPASSPSARPAASSAQASSTTDSTTSEPDSSSAPADSAISFER